MKECKIVRDLMPNYIEDLTSIESKEFIENHLETCEECTSYLNEMRAQMNLKDTDTMKQEIDYMKKAKKQMNIGKKLLTIIGLLIVVIGMLFWREIYQGILYADICRKHMFWSNQVIENGGYQLTVTGENYTEIFYCDKEKTVIESYRRENGGYTGDYLGKRAIYRKSDIPNTQMYFNDLGEQDDIRLNDVTLKFYGIAYMENEPERPYLSFFGFEKLSFWKLMKTFQEVVSIRIVEEHYILYLDSGAEIWVDRNSGLVRHMDSYDDIHYIFTIWNGENEKLQYPSDSDYIVLDDYENQITRSKEKTEVKISNCEEEAGTIVSYDFRVPKGGNESLEWFVKTDYENIRFLKINNLMTYQKLQERWEGIRDLTEEDFEHYFVLVVIDTDNTKEIEFKDLFTATSIIDDPPAKHIQVAEKDAQSEFLYSGSLVIVPNSEDVKHSGTTIFDYGLTVE